jgi:diguanylate cyclase (GGDEF)-like protein
MSASELVLETVRGEASYRPGLDHFFLVGLSGIATGLEFALEQPVTVIGRSTGCDVCLTDVQVSRRHVSLTVVPDPVRPGRSFVLVEDLNSRNGVRVAGYRVGSTLLEGGEKVLIGGSVFRLDRRDDFDLAQSARMHAMATLDPLTQLGNRKALHDAYVRCESRRESQGQPYAVLLVDLDRFKSVNDEYGHAAGDAALRRVSTAIRDCLRSTDDAFRLGGDEFMVILPGAEKADARDVADRIRAAIEATPVRYEDKVFTITASVGLARGGPRTLEEADRGLYAAKRDGRNVVAEAVH